MNAVHAPAPTPPSPVVVALHVRWYFGAPDAAEEPGGFISALLTAIARADTDNTERLRVAFPEYVEAMQLAQNAEAGMEVLRNRAVAR